MYRIAIVDDDYMVRESTKAVIERNFKEENFQVWILNFRTGMDWSLQKRSEKYRRGHTSCS